MGYTSALGLTLLVEVPIYALALWALLEVRPISGVFAGIGVNLLTHPLSFLLIQPALAGPLGFWRSLAVVEVVIWLVEGSALWIWLHREPAILFATSLLSNGLSLAVGLQLFR